MTDKSTILDAAIDGQPVHRRQFTKLDGRDIFFYGYKPHTLDPLEQDGGEVAKGGELRFHPLRREWNLYAPHRQNRTFKPSKAADPLAPSKAGGFATEIPFENFELAIFENKFTSLHTDAPPPGSVAGIEMARAKGRCDVVVYAPQGTGDLHSIGQAKRRLLIEAWIDRYHAMFAAGHDYVLPFENRGDEVGVTLAHPHGQIYAFPFVPDVQRRAASAFTQGYDLAKDIVRYAPDYAVAKAGGVTAFCPPFARFPYEVWLAPQRCKAGLWEFDATEKDGLAHLLGDVTRRYDALFERPTAYMMSLHAAPPRHDDRFHFTVQFYPLLRAPDRVKYLASVEQSTGVFTVDIMPEAAAAKLRVL